MFNVITLGLAIFDHYKLIITLTEFPFQLSMNIFQFDGTLI
jgi:hypothetical protein